MPGLGPLPAVTNVLSVKLKGTYAGQPWLNGLHLQHVSGGAPSAADCASIANAIEAAWVADLAALMHSNVILTEVEVTDLTSVTANRAIQNFSDAGTRAGTQLAVSIACVASEQIAFRYRGGHPRIYLPAGVVADITSGRLWSSGFVSAASTATANFLAALNAITVSGVSYRCVTVSYFTHTGSPPVKVYRTPPQVFPVQEILIHQRVDTQRRRLGKEPA